ncbi:ferredoxin [Aeromonas media]
MCIGVCTLLVDCILRDPAHVETEEQLMDKFVLMHRQ